jgi:hypothetical protein
MRIVHSYLDQTPGTTTQADDLQAFLDANLGTWSVGLVESRGSGPTERNFIVLTQGSQEILVIANQGTAGNFSSISYNNMIPADYRVTTSNVGVTSRYLAFAYAPLGGYTAAFAASLEPLDISFWPATSSPAYRMDFWDASNPNMDLYFFENSETEELIIYGGRTSSNNGYGCIIITEDLMDPTRGNLNLQKRGLLYLGTNTTGSGSPRPFNPLYTLYDESNGPMNIDTSGGAFVRGNLTILNNTNQPIEGNYISRELPVHVPSVPFGGVFNKDIILETGRMTNTYGTKKGSSDIYIHLYQDLFTVWTSDAPDPTVS